MRRRRAPAAGRAARRSDPVASRGTGGVDLTAVLGDTVLANPIVAAAGTFGHGAELTALCPPDELGAVTTKSVAAFSWRGNPALRVCPAPGGGMANSVGLAGPGVAAWVADDLPELRRRGATVIASIWGRSVDEFAAAARGLAGVTGELLAVEVNASCPNLEDRSRVFAHDPERTAEVVRAVRAELGPGVVVSTKLSPNVTDVREIASAAVEAGSDWLTLVNTLMGLVVDPEMRRPALGAGPGGISGPPLRPIALRAVWEVHRSLPQVPIIGTGGVASGTDAVEMLLVGASAVGVGTATFDDPRAAIRIREELRAWCEAHEVAAVRDLVGALAEPRRREP